MNQIELVQSTVKKLSSQIERLPDALSGISDEQFNRRMEGHAWTLGGIVDHMLLSHEPYLRIVTPLIDSSEGASGKDPKPSVIGKLLIKGAGPEGNAPAPKVLVPNRSHCDLMIVDRWLELHQEFLEVIKRAEDSNLQQKFENPTVSFVKLNLTDFLMFLPAHTERHVRQIEARRRLVQ